MTLFDPDNRNRSARNRRLYAAYEIAFTLVDFLAAASFIAGSVLFFYPSLQDPAIWLFVIGSIFFFLKPALRLAREIHFLAKGDVEDVAERFDP